MNPQDAEKLKSTFGEFRQTDSHTLIFGSGEKIFDLFRFIAENQIPVRKVERMEVSLENLFMESA